LFLTDTALYMLKSREILTIFYPKIVRLTYVTHGCHRVAETVKVQFPLVDPLIATVKKLFLKAPSRVLKFKEF